MGSEGTVLDAEGFEVYGGESRRQQGGSVEWGFSGSGSRLGGVGLVAGSALIGGVFHVEPFDLGCVRVLGWTWGRLSGG